jgi:hypothetical protein
MGAGDSAETTLRIRNGYEEGVSKEGKREEQRKEN